MAAVAVATDIIVNAAFVQRLGYPYRCYSPMFWELIPHWIYHPLPWMMRWSYPTSLDSPLHQKGNGPLLPWGSVYWSVWLSSCRRDLLTHFWRRYVLLAPCIQWCHQNLLLLRGCHADVNGGNFVVMHQSFYSTITCDPWICPRTEFRICDLRWPLAAFLGGAKLCPLWSQLFHRAESLILFGCIFGSFCSWDDLQTLDFTRLVQSSWMAAKISLTRSYTSIWIDFPSFWRLH